MDERAQIPVTLPRDNPTISYWQDPPDGIADLRSTPSLPQKADVVIVGSGITGAAVAWNLLQSANHDGTSPPAPSGIVMLEARQACSGATGRNGGHTKAASYRSFLDNAKTWGTETATKIARLELANINAMHAFAKEHSIPCDSNPCETLDVIYDEPHWDEAHRAVDAMRKALGRDDPAAEYGFHDVNAVKGRFHCAGSEPAPVGAVSYAAGSISAYKLTIGVLKLALAKGLNLQTHTPATKVTKSVDMPGMWEVHTPRGCIVTEKVVLATNGYTAHLWPEFQGAIVPLRGQITAQRPGVKLSEETLPTTYSFIYENGYEYMIPRPVGSVHEGDIVIGGGLAAAPEEGLLEYGTTDDTTLNETVSSYLYNSTAKYFGLSWGDDHPGGRIRREWTGIMGYSPDGFPYVGETPGHQGLWVSSSFQGHGMVLCWMCAKALVQMMQDREKVSTEHSLDEWFPDAFKVTRQRMKNRFQGRLHASAAVE